jgi:pSer/pThr/pTyr-binding forkhead associated (FHA) protein
MSMITCPNCQVENDATNQFCSKCGMWLQDFETTQPQEELLASISEMLLEQPQKIPSGHVILSITHNGEHMIISADKPILLGRSAGHVSPEVTLVDFNDYSGYVLGISREHAMITKRTEGYFLADRDSSNGTMLNGQKLAAFEEHQVHSGDNITLGKLTIIFHCE